MRAAFLLLLLAPAAHASSWWLDADHVFGAGGLTRTSASIFLKPSPKWVLGANSAVYRRGGAADDRVWTFRLPVMRAMGGGLLTLKPFIYPESGDYDASAEGLKAGFLLPLGEDGAEADRTLTLSAAWASKESLSAAGAGRKSGRLCALEAQLEQNFFDQFFFLAHASAFAAGGAGDGELAAVTLDSSDLAYLGSFAPVTVSPLWSAGLQFARNMAPDYDSHVYAGFSRISLRSGADASSGLLGMRLKLWETSSLDLGYNLYKPDGAGSLSRYKILYQVFF